MIYSVVLHYHYALVTVNNFIGPQYMLADIYQKALP